MSIGFSRHLENYLEFYNITQSEFASRLNISQKHMNEIINGKADMSVDLIVAISNLTGISIDFIIKSEYCKKVFDLIEENYTEDELKELLYNKFMLKKLSSLKWVNFKDITNNKQNYMDLLLFLKIRDFETLERINEKVLFRKEDNYDNDIIKVNLWIARCEELAQKQKVKEYIKENFYFLIDDLKNEMGKDTIDILKLQEILNNYGIYFVVENVLDGTKINGCFKVKLRNPAIYINKEYKTKYDFYFELFHELGHCKSDYNVGRSKVIIDGDEKREKRADNLAMITILGKDVFDKLDLNRELNEKDLNKISKENNIPIELLRKYKFGK